MKKKFKCAVLTTVFVGIVSNTVIASTLEKVKSYTKYEVNISEELYVPFEKSSKSFFQKGFVTGYGSGVTFKGYDKNGNPQFYAVSDRGPNADAPIYLKDSKESSAKVFPNAEFTPGIGILTIKDGKAIVDSDIKIKDSEGKNITGLPLQNDLVGSTGEVALDIDFNELGYDSNGLDTEGIAVDSEGNFWVCDEYGPFIIKLDKNGKLLKKYEPGNGLPQILNNRIPNRGFEGITISPSGKVYAVVQSVLDIDGETSKTASFTRIIELNPKTDEVKTYAYPVNLDEYSSPKNCKIGDIYAISDTSFIVIEQGQLKDKTMSNYIYKVDLSKATDITDIKLDDLDLEYITDTEKLKPYKFAKKQKLIDLRQLGWTAEKAEGLCLFNNNKTIAVINDNDFGVAIDVKDNNNKLKDIDITDYIYNADKKTFLLGATTNIDIEFNIRQNSEPAEIWLIEMETALK